MWFFLAGAIVTEVIATLSLRASEGGRKKLWLVPVVVGYGAAFTFLALALSAGMGIGVAYGVWAASGVALTAIAGKILFKEPLTAMMSAGIALIIGGVLLIETG
ncbi:multidrug efflux SMR transporter [Rhodococcus sp. BP-252]|uniref:Cation transporter n=1 Tax=Rhodococcoides kyotonense TaxID=398843 RepID=A0A177YMK5_9NOCA|nr:MULTISPECIES: multidrug efflux SMR transporter [Rhodococcus]MBY6412520.1 multidrug efflux SMR transporter [Rhodococcus sp. BP-320]MBY6417225.1 multidrug efflux SMR transporter [Rhodococcus sp. BP-321]MBY6424150.1 multidrug efflux SMR transporter [Rhodococcus sp. BP-324]MBY6427249.1 multidrug efflux SMR transporter [Rhodococcus sp. BP-323]MBY6432138.1 multidrug efflux SMR transporter [Rhodococcus sp. BP-322]